MGTVEEHRQAAAAVVTWKREAWVRDHLSAAAKAAEVFGTGERERGEATCSDAVERGGRKWGKQRCEVRGVGAGGGVGVVEERCQAAVASVT
jgi:hypothetical protein